MINLLYPLPEARLEAHTKHLNVFLIHQELWPQKVHLKELGPFQESIFRRLNIIGTLMPPSFFCFQFSPLLQYPDSDVQPPTQQPHEPLKQHVQNVTPEQTCASE